MLILCTLFLFTCSLYLLTYSGGMESGDAARLYDGMNSLVAFGDVLLDGSADRFPPLEFNAPLPALPLAPTAVEPGQMVLSAPLYLLARALPGFGLAHVTWLFNVLVGALTVCTFYAYARMLGASPAAAALAALGLAAGSILWVYSQTYFREPLLGLGILLLALCVEHLRRHGLHVPALAGAAGAVLLIVLTKASGLMALPALMLMALPDLREHRRVRVALLLVGAVLLAAALLFIAIGWFDVVPGLAQRYNILARLRSIETASFGYAIASYLFSPGGSFWATSPVLLLAVPGVVLLWRARQRRMIAASAVMIACFSAGYALLNGTYWFGGLSWPPRFLVPMIPFVMIVTLPVWQRVAAHPRSLWTVAVAVALGWGAWVQINGLVIPWGAYSAALPSESGGFLEWQGGLYDPAFFRWVLMPPRWAQIIPSIAWQRFALPAPALGFAATAVLCLLWLAVLLRRPVRRMARVTAALALVLAGITAGGLLALAPADDRYRGYDQPLHDMLRVIERETRAGDVLVLGSPSLAPFFSNFDGQRGGARVIALPLQPGERSSPEQPAEFSGDLADAQLRPETAQLLAALASTHDRLWLLVDGGPDLWWSTRPVERWLMAHYGAGQPITTSPITRLIAYSSAPAPDPLRVDSPPIPVALDFGGQMRLLGASLPAGDHVAAGALLPVSLYWAADDPIERRYTAALYLRDASGGSVSQHDGAPSGGFLPTDQWPPHAPLWDNRALHVPETTAPGSYQVWVKVYDFDDSGVPRDLPVSGADALDDVIGRLPLTITVTAGE